MEFPRSKARLPYENWYEWTPHLAFLGQGCFKVFKVFRHGLFRFYKHEGCLFGIPPIPKQFRKDPKREDMWRHKSFKEFLASRAIDEYFRPINMKAKGG